MISASTVISAQDLSYFKDSAALTFHKMALLIPPQKLSASVKVKKTIITPIDVDTQQPQPTLVTIEPIITAVSSVEKPKKERFEFVGKKLIYSKIINAPPLLYRDNSNYNIKYLDKAHGAFSNAITDIKKDAQNLIWMGSENDGVAIYNGYTFKIIDEGSGAPSKNIEQLYSDSQNRLWIATKKGICYIKNDSIFTLKHPNNEVQYASTYEDLDHAIWLTTYNKGALKYQKDSVEIYNSKSGLSDNDVSTVYQSSDRMFWFGMNNGKGFSTFDGTHFNHYFLNKNKFGANVKPFIEFEGAIWIGAFGAGLTKYVKGKLYTYEAFKPLSYATYSFAVNDNGLWFSIYGYGLGNFKQGKLKLIGKDDGLTDNNIYKIVIDNQNNIWLGSLFAGFLRFDENVFYKNNFNNKTPISRVANIVTDQAGTEWYLPNGGKITAKKGTKFYSYLNEGDIKTPQIQHAYDAYFEAPGKAWMATLGAGIVYFTEKNYTFFNFGKNNEIYKIDRDLENRVWFASNLSGVIYHLNNVFYKIDKKNGLACNSITTLLCDAKGQTWLALENHGLAIVNKDSIRYVDKKNGLISNNINVLFQDKKQRLWLGSLSEGVQIIDGEKHYIFNVKKGLLSNNILGITQTNENNFWITTTEGLTRLSFDDNQKPIIKNFDKNYGINLVELSAASKVYDSDKIVFGANRGVLVYQKDFERTQLNTPVLFLEKISLDGTILQKLPTQNKIKVAQNKSLAIDFYALNWGQENTLKYEYKILNKNNHSLWISLGNYPNLDLQKFELYDSEIQIRALSANRISNIIKIPIEIKPYFYQNIYYHILFWIILIGLALFYYQYKKRLALKKAHELEGIIDKKTKEILSEKEALEKSYLKINTQIKEKDVLIHEVHHRVKNNLQLISSLVSMQLNALKSEKSKKILTETYNRINAMAMVHEILYYKENVSYISLRAYLSNLINSINELMNQDKIKIVITKSIEDINIDISYCIALGMITNEAISNTVKHAFKHQKQPEVKIDLYCDSKTKLIVYSIKDNGIGIDSKYLNTENKSLGLRLITIFSKQLNAQLEIKNEGGTEILVKFRCEHHENCSLERRNEMDCDL